LRAGCVVASIIEQTNLTKEILMWFRTLLDSMKPRRSGTPVRRTPRRPTTSRLRLEALEDRCLLSFSPAVTYPVGAFGVLAGDLNGDQMVDLMASGKVLLGNSDGTFQPALDSGAVDTWALADLNRDGRLDAVSFGSNGFDVQLGNGDGTFQPVQTYGYENGGYNAAAMGDINNDGNPDVVMGWNQVVQIYEPCDCDGIYFSEIGDVYLGDGAGGLAFSSSVELVNTWSYPDWPDRASLMLADFSGDGRLDIAAASASYSDWHGVTLLGNGDGTFQAPYYQAPSFDGYYFPPLLAGDFNGDNRLDIAGPFTVQLGNGDGTFQSPQRLGSDSSPGFCSLTAGEFNGDGRLDLVTTYPGAWDAATGQYVGGYVSVLLGNGNGTFQAARDFAPGAGPYSLAVADFNGDARSDLAVGLQSSAAIAIMLNDGNWPAVPSITINDVTVTEGNTGSINATFTVSLSAAYGQPVTVNYSTADGTAVAGSDYEAQSGTLTFAPGETMKIITVAVIGDRLVELEEPFLVNLSSATNAAIADREGQGTILDDEPHVSINDVTMKEGNSGLTAFAFTVSLSVAYDVPVTVNFATANGTATAGSDYQAASDTLTIPAGQTSGTITILVTGDRLVESNKTFFVNLSNLNYGAIADGQGLGTIVDDEPRISIADVTMKEGNSGLTAFAFTVSLSVAYDVPVTVNYATANGTATAGSDYQAASGTLTIPAGQTSGTITVQVTGDRLAEPNKTFFVNLSNLNYGVIADAQGLGTIVDDEPRISISDVTKKEGNGNKTTLFVFTVTLSAAYDQPVTMSYRTVDGTATTSDSDYIAKSGTLTFAPGETTKTITIEVNSDRKNEANETFYLDLFGNSSNSLFTKNRGLGTILNDD
jgi:hypothetical protein